MSLVYPYFELPTDSLVNQTLLAISSKLSTLITSVDKIAAAVLDDEMQVRITSIPTEDAIVVTNNILHPALDVVVII